MDPQVVGGPHVSRPLLGWSLLPDQAVQKLRTPLIIATLITLFTGSPAWAAEGDITLPAFDQGAWLVLGVAALAAIVSIAFAVGTRAKIKAQSPGSAAMVEVAAAIEDGAMAYLKQQIRLMAVFVAILFVILWLTYSNILSPVLAFGTAVAFILGVGASYLAGFIGMKMAVEGNVRTANAALSSFKFALETAFRSGSVAGMATVGLGLLGATIIFAVFREEAMKVLVGFGFGGSLAALFMRVGGGIFTKAADVGADLVGKVEQNIPEDDPRNAATIADNVGDNVGDCAGMAADVFESYEVTLVAAIILGVAIPGIPDDMRLKLAMFPLLVRSVGVFASIIGIQSVKGRDDEALNPMQPISRGFWLSAILATIGFVVVAAFYLPSASTAGTMAGEWWRYAAATFMGIVLALVIEKVTEFYTATEKAPVREIAESSRTGPATMILSGFAEGLESAWWGVIAIGATLLGSMALFPGEPALAMYGVSLAGLGLLTTTGFILAEDTFGPISDNANGIFEMSGALEESGERGVAASRIVAKLDAVGNTTKALTKGFAIATAVIAAVALFSSFIEDAGLHDGIPINNVKVFVGLLIGGAVPFLFSSFAIRAVSRAAVTLVEEVRRQFREIPGIMEGKARPEYGRCVAICTAAAQRELLGPGILAIATPILVAFGLGFDSPHEGAMALGGFFAGAILSGQLMAVLLSNSGGAWDNAKKLIEEGLYGGKGSDNHKAAVICDTVGDPFKDTAGPALNPLIKVMNLVGLLIAPMAINPNLPTLVRVLVVVVTGGALGWAIAFSRRKAPVGLAATPDPSGPSAPLKVR